MNAADIANLINYAFVLFFGIIAAFYMDFRFKNTTGSMP